MIAKLLQLIWATVSFGVGGLLVIAGWCQACGVLGFDKDTSTLPIAYMLLGLFWVSIALFSKPD